MEAVTKTFRELLRSGWPNQIQIGENFVPAVWEQPIMGWYHGDRELIALNELPAIAIDPESFSVNWMAFQTHEREYKFDVLCYCRRDDYDDSTSMKNEMARLVERTVRNMSRWWVFEKCYFDSQPFIDPEYLRENYNSILSSYETQVQNEFNTSWTSAHTGAGSSSPPAAPTLRANDLSVSAYLKLFYEDPLTASWANTEYKWPDPTDGPYTTTPKDTIISYREAQVVPARYISDCRITDGSFGFIAKGGNLLSACQIRVYAKEVEPVMAFGPL